MNKDRCAENVDGHDTLCWNADGDFFDEVCADGDDKFEKFCHNEYRDACELLCYNANFDRWAMPGKQYVGEVVDIFVPSTRADYKLEYAQNGDLPHWAINAKRYDGNAKGK